MVRGIISGSVWAVVVAGTGLGLASLSAPIANRGDAPTAPQMAAPQPLGEVLRSDTAASLPTAADPTPPRDAPEAVSAVPVTETAPSISLTVPDLPPTPDTLAVIESPKTIALPDVPGPEIEVVRAAPGEELTMAAPDAAAIVETTAAPPPLAPAEEPVEDVAAPEAEAEAPTPVMVAEAPESVTPEPEPEPEQEPVAEEVLPEVEPATIVEAPATASDVTTDALTETSAPATDTEPATQTPSTETVIAEAPAAEQPEPVQQTATPTVRVIRPGAAPSETAGQVATVVTEDAEEVTGPALARLGVPFENPDDLPLISLMLVDDARSPVDTDAIASLGFTPTVAIDPLATDAGARMTAYRAAGAEIALQPGLPAGARPADVEVALDAAFRIVPEAAMLFSDGSDMVQGSRDVTAQAMAFLAADGHGFVAVQRGLGSVTRDAEEAGVPAVAVEREIDPAGANARATGRALDQAAFRARQTGSAVVMAPVDAATLAALRDWAQGVDRDQLLIAPVSAVLLADEG